MHFEEFRLNHRFKNKPPKSRTDAGREAPVALDEAPAAFHEMIVAIATSMLTNKKVYICFISALAMLLAASPMNRLAAAGNIPAVENPSPQASQKTLVVRADRRTGRLVRSVVPANSPAVRREPSINISEMVEKAAHDNNVDPLLVHSIIQVRATITRMPFRPRGPRA